MGKPAMSATTSKFFPSDSYLDLVRQFPLRPIRTNAEYKAATAVMERLALVGEADLDGGQRDYLDALDEFISAYDRKAMANRPRRGSPHQRLRSLVAEAGLSQRDLQRILGCGHSLVSMLLGGKRELSKDNIRQLAKYFKLSAD